MIPKKHDEIYSRLIGSRRWKRLRAEYLGRHPLCEICDGKGLTVQGEEVHHITAISTGQTSADKRRLAYDTNNLMTLCRECHRSIHDAQEPQRGLTRAANESRARAQAREFLKYYIK